MRASVVIPCRDAAATLGEQLEALSRQTVSTSWEVVVANNGSVDGSVALAESFRDRLPALSVVDADERCGPGHARNRGAEAARGDMLLFCDADDVVADGWLGATVTALETRDAVASRFELERLNPDWIVAGRTHPQQEGLNPYTYPDYLPHAGGSGLGVRRELHETLGGFDETLPALEDTDYCWRLQQRGFELAFAGDAVVHVRLPSTLRGLFRQSFRYGVYNVLLYKRYRRRDMPRLALSAGVARWAKLALTAAKVVTRSGRGAWVSQLGWRLGRLAGCVRYGVLAP